MVRVMRYLTLVMFAALLGSFFEMGSIGWASNKTGGASPTLQLYPYRWVYGAARNTSKG